MEQIYKIFSIVSGRYLIKNNENEQWVYAAGKLRYQEQTPLVGDDIILENNTITKILDRKNSFIRPKVANIDQIFIFMSIKEPNFLSYLVDKYMSIIENKNIIPILCITKTDLDTNQAKEWEIQYKNMGYEVVLINNENPSYIQKINKLMTNKYSVFMGQSGVGKTTTLNILGNLNYQTQEISKSLGRGKHTTRTTYITKINQGWLIDTPGFSSFDLNISKLELAQSFKVFNELSKLCKFRSCLHLEEETKDCAIKQKIDTKEIPLFRYQNYVKLLTEIQNERK
ncbi:ribosome small subunit-dependent GTPase A [Mycoplasmopsis felis]|uniref:ribosome small subunit-dependent GTPase A n=1 Tax=Mycoplasmopsis felis TaxID=33923 RepID=UPI002AFECEDC|nr:ribosome small subunit-dependent GTPase A [Mycoplasmopsis felis]WQQ05606.1 ribosome small subunit-dependent GTPase A [Mycoplasmopsis felis]